MRFGLEGKHPESPILYPFEVTVVIIDGALVILSLKTVTLAQPSSLLPSLETTKFQDGKMPFRVILPQRHCTMPYPPLCTKELLQKVLQIPYFFLFFL